jgi:type II secretory ATPase GspE/PulE/Tfp pilus assembly ATPase PilB-like protein
MIKKILFPTDYSASSDAALRHAISLAQQSDATLLVAHIEPRSPLPRGTVGPPGEDLDEEEQGLLALLSLVKAEGAKSVAHEFRKLRGDPASEIVRLAQEEGVDLIVMATAGRTGLRRLVMGSVAEAVTRDAPCPVLSLKEPLAHQPLKTLSAPQGKQTSELPSDANVAFEDPAQVLAEAGAVSAVRLLEFAVGARATDVHLFPVEDDVEVKFRIDGRLEPFCRLPREVGRPLVVQLKVMSDLNISDPFHPQEARVVVPHITGGYEVRMTTVPVLGGESIALRVLRRDLLLRPLDSLGLTAQSLEQLGAMLRQGEGEGVVLVTGPSGSGKTTTAYSMVHALDDGHRNIVTVEDPPEYHVASFRQLAADPRHAITMTSGLRTLLRMDPDIVLVGEIRDAETAEIAMRAASSGKFVFTTLHTRDVASTVTALRDLHIDNRSLAGNLSGIISQRLVRRLCTHCRAETSVDEATVMAFENEDLELPTRLFRPVGCAECRHTGYRERIGVFETAVPDRAIREAIERSAAEEELRDLLRAAGTHSLRADGLMKVRDGITTLAEIDAMTWNMAQSEP